MRSLTLLLLTASAATSPAAAQIVNGNFDSGSFPPWVVTPTAGGGSGLPAVAQYDIDGPGPQSTSNAARFMVGRSSPGTVPEGITMSQSLNMRAGVEYRFSLYWSAHALVNVYNATAGTFEIVIDGVSLTSATAPILAQGTRAYGTLTATYQAPSTGPRTFAIRITRPVLFGEEVFQYIDIVRGACYPDCDGQANITANDFQCFLNAFAANLPYANCDGSTGSPTHTANDFQCFLNRVAMGCW